MASKKKPCKECQTLCTGTLCRRCYTTQVAARAESRRKDCAVCGRRLHRQTEGDLCYEHTDWRPIRQRFEESASTAPPIQAIPHIAGDAIVCSDLHVPWHSPEVCQAICEAGTMLGVRTLIVAGDFFHFDKISKYIGVARSVSTIEELQEGRRVIETFETVFDRIIVIPGNHDQRFEKMVARWKNQKDAADALEYIAAIFDRDPEDIETITSDYLGRFLHSPHLEWHPLPQLILNGRWLIQHPGTCRRIPASNELAMVRKHRMCVVQGHNHLYGLAVDESGEDIAFNLGHGSADEKYRYVRERPTTFPSMVHGFGAIICDTEQPKGRLLPLALHDKWFNLRALAARLKQGGSAE